MARVRWKLREYLEIHGITAYQLGKEMGGQTRMPNLYRVMSAAEGPSRVDLDTLGEIIEVLRRLTGKKVSVCDLLEYPND